MTDGPSSWDGKPLEPGWATLKERHLRAIDWVAILAMPAALFAAGLCLLLGGS